MPKYLMLLAGASVLAFVFPSAFERYKAHMAETQSAEAVEAAPGVIEAAQPIPAPMPSGRAVQLQAGPDGHFRTAARLNGRSTEVLVDTGATYVSMNEATARKLGIVVPPDAYRYTAETANGPTPVAIARLDKVEIGRVTVRDVDAMISRGDGLSTTLLGMSFLGKLKRFGVEADRLNLVE